MGSKITRLSPQQWFVTIPAAAGVAAVTYHVGGLFLT